MENSNNYNMFYMMVISALSPVLSEVIKIGNRLIGNFIKFIESYINRKFEKKYNSITISISEKVSGLSQRVGDSGDYDGSLIIAIMEYVNNHKCYSQHMKCKTTHGKLIDDENGYMRRLKTHLSPTEEVMCDGFIIIYSTDIESVNKNNNEGTTSKALNINKIQLTIKSTKSIEEIQKFIDMCFDLWKDRYYPVENKHKAYFYDQIPSTTGGNVFNRYKINNTTTFDDIFFPEKDRLISLVDKVQSGELKKLGILLHGVPGCGKTSCIKSIAHRTGRNVVNLKLSLMKTDSDLFQAFHGEVIPNNREGVQGEQEFREDTVSNNKRIYILEDIDAECDIVHKRAKYIEDKSSESGQELSKMLYDELKKKFNERGITLSGILNALDGVMEMTGSIIIMTTNHVDKLDKALIRPGRITVNLELKFMNNIDGNKLIYKKYSATVNELEDNVFTPATLESLIHQSNNIDELRLLVVDYQRNRNHITASSLQ